MTAVDDQIEFLDVADDGEAVTVVTVAASNTSILRFWPLLVVACCAGWLVLSGGPVDAPDSAAGPQLDRTPMPTVAPITPMARSGLAAIEPIEPVESSALWPTPALDRDNYVVRIPGDRSEPIGSLERTIVYMNTLGDPTVFSLVTGDVYEIDVAPVRIHETFAVEDGGVRSLEGANPALPDATDDSVIFHTYRATDPPGVGTVTGRLSPPELCLSGESCRTPGFGVDRLVVGSTEVERFDPAAHRDVAAILAEWTPVDRWLVAPDEDRIPAPHNDLIWVITPSDGSSVSNVGAP